MQCLIVGDHSIVLCACKVAHFILGYNERLLIPNPQTTHLPKTNLVAFYAYMSQDFPNPGASHTLVFDTVVTNVGSGYHSTTGVFLAPETGVYVFSWSMRLANGEYHQAELVHNYQVMGVAYLYAPTGDHTVSETIVIHVNQGDDVYLRTQGGPNNGDIESGTGGRSIFSGWKLN
uniref:Complement C1q-like protein 4 n=1 Tax=Magallana gigas TaxID=29159 RepID=K1PU36_MAGGI